jgi:ubiquinone/menaquinone biosynthesis C-methylase UbiE
VRYGRLGKIFAFGDYDRDQWVAKEAKSLPKGSRVLDVGAGNCRYRRLFDHCVYKTHDFAKLAEESTGGGYGKLDYVSDICSIPVENGSFDVILCTEVLEHVPEPVRAIREMARILKQNGTLLLTAPQRSGLHQAPYHFYGGYTPFWYQYFLPQYNLKIVSMEANGGFFKHYGEETQRFVSILFADKGRLRYKRVLFFPVFVVCKLYALAVCILCYWLDRIDTAKDFTVGYHIKATKIALK